MRSPREIAFRIRQETANLFLLAARPAIAAATADRPRGLPSGRVVADALQGPGFADSVDAIARQVLRHRIPCLGFELDTGASIDWRRDYVHGVSTPATYFRRIPYLDFRRAGDHKIIWELNRHQYLVTLAQAWLFTGHEPYIHEIGNQLQSWLGQNPFQKGINWASALEAAFRALSWIWILHLAGDRLGASLYARIAEGLYRHGLHLEYNLSVYFSPNTHLLGEAVALHAIGRLLPSLPRAARWRELGGRIVREQMDAQVKPDGSHFEQSSYYHVYALDMFLFHSVIEDTPPEYRQKMASMAEYLHALLGPSGQLPMLGDDDGGRFFHPFGDRRRFGRATMATCAAIYNRPEWLYDAADLHEQAVWWLGPDVLNMQPVPPVRRSALFRDAGIAALQRNGIHAVVDCGPFGSGSAGHSHSDTLSLVVYNGDEEVLIDPATYTYVSDPQWRDWFRGSGAHNTVRVDGRDQAAPSGSFRWLDPPAVEVQDWRTGAEGDFLHASCSYGGFRHRRQVTFSGTTMMVVDEIEGPPGRRLLEQFWHAGAEIERLSPTCFRIGRAALVLPAGAIADVADGWRSDVFGVKKPAQVVRVRYEGVLPARMVCVLELSGLPSGDAHLMATEAGYVIGTGAPTS